MCMSLQRTQILLEQEQVLGLREFSRRESKSLAQIIREMVDEGLRRRRQRRGKGVPTLEEMRGIFNSGGAMGSKEHDEVLYG